MNGVDDNKYKWSRGITMKATLISNPNLDTSVRRATIVSSKSPQTYYEVQLNVTLSIS